MDRGEKRPAHPIKLYVLGSGSKGNSAIVEDTATGDAVLIDCGICKRDLVSFSTQDGFSLERLRAILITHEHSDHVKSLPVILRYLKKHDFCVPVYVNSACIESSKQLQEAQTLADMVPLASGDHLAWGSLDAYVFSTSHDAAYSVGFRFETPDDALGYITDSGVIFQEAKRHLSNVRILALEANHDALMLKNGPYPYRLKERISSNFGHLSNEQAAMILEELISPRLEQVVAMHISQNNNTYRKAVEALRSVVDASGQTIEVVCSYQSKPRFVS